MGRPGYIGGESISLHPGPGAAARLSILVAPYRNRLQIHPLIADGNRDLVLFAPSNRAPTREQARQQLHGMSPSEAWLATCLAGGQGLEQIANEHGLSKETLRSCLQRIFAKTATRRQSELPKLLLVVRRCSNTARRPSPIAPRPP